MEGLQSEDLNGGELAVDDQEKRTETDAGTFGLSFLSRRKTASTGAIPDATDVTRSEIPASNPGCEKDAEEYNMRHPRRGVAVIFNHQKFDRMDPRSGTDKDCVNLSVQLKRLGFEVRSYDDLTYTELSQVLRSTAKEDHSTADCLMVVVMSHGEPKFLHSRDTMYQTEELWKHFMGKKCPTLVGKPKLFFIQACRGTSVDKGVRVDQTDGYSMAYLIPQYADILVAYSTMEGHYSWRNPRRGSWFIQALCDELQLNGEQRDILTLLTFVCRRVAIEYQSFVPDDPDMDMKKQIPSIMSMLTRLVYFYPKK